MPPMNERFGDAIPEHHLRLALRASTPEQRVRYAEQGLAYPPEEVAPDTRVLLLRQLYIAALEQHRFRAAIAFADEMGSVGPLRDIALHDRARAEQAVGDVEAAVRSARLATRHAPADRRSFMMWSLATIEHFAGQPEEALDTLDKALLLSTRDRPLLKAHGAYIELERGNPVEGLTEMRQTLAGAACGEGYGQYLLGMIGWHLGDTPAATVHLQAFVRRNAQVDAAKALTLREELRRARLTLAELSELS